MSCLHCYSRPEARAAANDLTTEQASRIVEQLIEAEVMHVHFGGGEPLGRADFIWNAETLAKTGMSITLSTNGSLMTEEIAERLAALSVDTVAFSIHGSDANSHDSFNTFPGAWERLILAIERMTRRGVKVKLVMTLTKQTAPHAPRLIELANSWGVYMVQFQSFKQYGNANLNLLRLNMSRPNWLAAFRAIEAKRAAIEATGSKLKVDLGLDSDPVLAAEIGLPSVLKKCICGIHSVTIKPNGDIVPCSFVPEIIGNILQHSTLLQIWQESPVLRRLRTGSSSPCGK